MGDLLDEVGALLVERALNGLGLADWEYLAAVEIERYGEILTDFGLGILKFRLEEAELLELDIEKLLVLSVIVIRTVIVVVLVGHVVSAV
jgi:hypothetical protein